MDKVAYRFQTLLGGAAVAAECLDRAPARPCAVDDMGHLAGADGPDAPGGEKFACARAHDVGIDFAHAAQNHQGGGPFAYDLVGDERTVEHPGLLAEKPEEVADAPLAERTDLPAVGDHARALLGMEPPDELLPFGVAENSCLHGLCSVCTGQHPNFAAALRMASTILTPNGQRVSQAPQAMHSEARCGRAR